MITKRICIGLQRADAERLLHGSESGIIVRDPSGAYSEGHMPISQEEAYTLTQQLQPMPLVAGGEQGALTDRQYQREQIRRRATRFYFIDDLRKPTRAELEEAAAHLNHEVDAHSHGHSYPPTDSGHAIGDGHGNGHGNGHGDGHGMVTAMATVNSRPGRTSPSSTTRPLAELTVTTTAKLARSSWTGPAGVWASSPHSAGNDPGLGRVGPSCYACEL